MLHPGLAEIGFSGRQLRLGTLAMGATMVISPAVTGTIT